MKLSSVVFAALFTFAANAHAVFTPGNGRTQIYYCQAQNLQTKIFHESTGGASIVVESLENNKAPQVLMNEKVTELKNKSQTVFTSEGLILKITNHPSGQLPGTMFVDKDSELEKFDMNCQIVYTIMGDEQTGGDFDVQPIRFN
jgi:hypothetical protein